MLAEGPSQAPNSPRAHQTSLLQKGQRQEVPSAGAAAGRAVHRGESGQGKTSHSGLSHESGLGWYERHSLTFPLPPSSFSQTPPPTNFMVESWISSDIFI